MSRISSIGGQNRWYILFFLLIICISSTIGLFLIQKQKQSLTDSTIQQLQSITNLKASRIHEWRHTVIGIAETLKKRQSFTQDCASFIKNNGTADQNRRMADQLAVMNQVFQAKAVYLISTRGTTVYSTDHGRPCDSKTISELHLYRRKSNTPLLSDLYLDSLGEVLITLYFPILETENSAQETVIGYIVVNIVPQTAIFSAINEWPSPNKTGECLIVKKAGDSVLYINDLRHLPDAALRFKLPIADSTLPAARAVTGHLGAFEGIDYRGNRVISYSQQIPDSDWYLVGKIDYSEIYEETAAERQIISIITIFTILIGAGALLLLWNHQQKLFYREEFNRQQEREALKRHYDLLTQQANDIILFFDEQLNIIECNETALLAYGYSRDEFIGLNIEQIRVGGNKDRIVEQDREAIRSNNRVYEAEDRRKNGSRFSVEVSANLVEVDGVQYYQHIARDITQRKTIEKKLFAEQEFIRQLIDNTSEAIIGFDHNGLIVLINKLAKFWFQDSVSESPSETWIQNITIRDQQGTLFSGQHNPLSTVCTGSVLNNVQLTILSKDAPDRHIRVNGGPFYDQQGQLLGAVVVMHDITEQTKLQNQISEEKNFTEKVINASPSIIYIFDLVEAKNLYSNDGIETILGYSKQDIQSMGAQVLPLLMHPEDFVTYAEQTLQRYQVLADHEQIEQSFRMKRKDGEWRWLFTRESVFKRLPSGEPQQILGVSIDVTEERKRQILLAKREDILQRTGMMAKIGGWEFDPRTGEGSWTDEVARIHDLDPSVATSAEFGVSFYQGIYKEMITAAINDAVKLGKPYDLELELISAKGVKKWIRTKGQPVKEKDEVVLVSGIFQDITEQRNTEYAYRNSEQNYYELFNNMLDGFIYCKVIYSDKAEITDALVLSANIRFLQLIEKKNVIGEKLTDLLPDIISSAREFPALFATVSYSGVPGKLETFFPKLNKWFTISVYSKENGNFAAILDDITERKLNEEKIQLLNAELEQKILERTAQLHDSEERFTKIFYLSPVGIIIAKIADGNIMDLNDSYAEMSGFPREELINTTAAEVGILPKAERQELMVELKARGKIRHHEMQICSKSGKIIDVSLSMEKITLGNEDYVVSIVNDITTRKQIENQIKQISERYVLATASAKVGIWEWDIVTNNLIWDDRLYSLYGVTREQFPAVLDAWIKCLHPDDEKRVTAQLWAAVEGKCDYTPQFRTIWPDGSIHHIQAHGVVSRAPDGSPLYMLGTGWDITAEMEAKQQLQELNISLQTKEASLTLANKELEAFSYSVSHDLRAPLRAIDGFAKMLSEEFSAVINDEALRLLTVIIQNTKKMGSLIDDLLAFSRLSRQKSKIVAIPMKQLVMTVIEEFTPLFDFNTLRIEVEELPDIVGDTAMMRQVWRNLIGNALKFSSKVTAPIIRISAKVDGNMTTYCIRDNGVGFDMQYAAKLFGVFQRLHATNEFEGTGVGLAIVQRIVHRFGGSIYAESEPNKGATFYITLPNNLEIDHGNKPD